jgi:hypothetical protein
VPPLPELVVLGELAQSAADGSSDIGLDEIGQVLASRFVEVVSGKPRNRARMPRATAAARWKPRCGSMPIRTSPSLWKIPPRRPGSAPFHFLRLFSEVLGDPAPISGALTAAPCGGGSPTTTARSPISYDVGFADLSTSCAPSAVPPAPHR